MFIFIPFGPIMSPGFMSGGQGPIHLASWVMTDSALPWSGGE